MSKLLNSVIQAGIVVEDIDATVKYYAEELGVVDKEIVSVKVESNGRSLIFGDVVVRVSDSYALAMHIDTDESNAGLVPAGAQGVIVK